MTVPMLTFLFLRRNRVGAKRAEKFYEEGYRNLQDLKGREKLTHAQKVGLQYFEVSSILHNDMSELLLICNPIQDFEALIPRT